MSVNWSQKKRSIIRLKKRLGDCASLISDFRKAKKKLDLNPIYSDLNTIIDSTWKVYKKSKA